jgi:hypothetical protein
LVLPANGDEKIQEKLALVVVRGERRPGLP